MTLAPTAPTAPPLHSVAPTAMGVPLPAAQAATPLSVADMAASIEASADPAAELAHLVVLVSSRSATAARQGQLLSTVRAKCEQTLKSVRIALLAAVIDRPGAYDGFTIIQKSGSRSINYSQLQELYPDVYDELVRVGEPSLAVNYT